MKGDGLSVNPSVSSTSLLAEVSLSETVIVFLHSLGACAARVTVVGLSTCLSVWLATSHLWSVCLS